MPEQQTVKTLVTLNRTVVEYTIFVVEHLPGEDPAAVALENFYTLDSGQWDVVDDGEGDPVIFEEKNRDEFDPALHQWYFQMLSTRSGKAQWYDFRNGDWIISPDDYHETVARATGNI